MIDTATGKLDGLVELMNRSLGPAPLSRPLSHWDGNVFAFTFVDENASPGTIAKATFAPGRVPLEYYDGEGLGTFVR